MMKKFMKLYLNIRYNDSGATLIEYSLIAGLVAVVAIVVLGEAGTAIEDIFGVVRDELEDAATSAAGGGNT
ncbi:MAG: Flp family type IVb pilin [Pseudomonadota bacterium]